MSESWLTCPATPSGPTFANACPAAIAIMTLFDILSNVEFDQPCSRSTICSEPKTRYDFIVVGGGVAGSVVASRLSENPNWSVLLVEAGDIPPYGTAIPGMKDAFFETKLDWNWETESADADGICRPKSKCKIHRGKVLGGSSVLNGLVYTRGNTQDFDRWVELGNPGWGQKDVLPFFKKAENFLHYNAAENRDEEHCWGTKGKVCISRPVDLPEIVDSILEGAGEIGYGTKCLTCEQATGFEVTPMAIKKGERVSAETAYLRPARECKNLDIIVNSVVKKLLVETHDSKHHATGIEIVDRHGHEKKIFVEKEIIITGGAISSPAILLRSGIGPAQDLREIGIEPILELPGVGLNLQNHMQLPLKVYINEFDTNPLNYISMTDYLVNRTGILASDGLACLKGKISTKYTNEYEGPDLQINFNGYTSICSNTWGCNELLSDDRRSIEIIPVLLRPKSVGYVKLKSSNYLQQPLIVPNYLSHKNDVKVLVEGVKFVKKLINSPALKKLGAVLDCTRVKGCEHLDYDTEKYWRCAISKTATPTNEPVGTSKMGFDPFAVVDHNLKVYGFENLRIIGSTVMPKIISGEIMASTYMISEKGAELIKITWT